MRPREPVDSGACVSECVSVSTLLVGLRIPLQLAYKAEELVRRNDTSSPDASGSHSIDPVAPLLVGVHPNPGPSPRGRAKTPGPVRPAPAASPTSLCRDFARGACQRTNCRFVHGATLAAAPPPQPSGTRAQPAQGAYTIRPHSWAPLAVVPAPITQGKSAPGKKSPLLRSWLSPPRPEARSMQVELLGARDELALVALRAEECAQRTRVELDCINQYVVGLALFRLAVARSIGATSVSRCPSCVFVSPWPCEVADHVFFDHHYAAIVAFDESAYFELSRICDAEAASAALLLSEYRRLHSKLSLEQKARARAAQPPPGISASSRTGPAPAQSAPPVAQVVPSTLAASSVAIALVGQPLLEGQRLPVVHVVPSGPTASTVSIALDRQPLPEGQHLANLLYEYVNDRQPEQSSKITGMLLAMDNSQILLLLDSPALLDVRISEAMDVLNLIINADDDATRPDHANDPSRSPRHSGHKRKVHESEDPKAAPPPQVHADGEDRGALTSCGDCVRNGQDGHAMSLPTPLPRRVSFIVDDVSSNESTLALGRLPGVPQPRSPSCVSTILPASAVDDHSDDDTLTLGQFWEQLQPRPPSGVPTILIQPQHMPLQFSFVDDDSTPACAPAVTRSLPLPMLRPHRPAGATFSWFFVPLIASAYRMPGVPSLRAVHALTAPLFLHIASLIGRSTFQPRWRQNSGYPYITGPQQEDLQDILGDNVDFQEALNLASCAGPCPVILPAVLPVVGCSIAADASGVVYQVTHLSNGFATLVDGAGTELHWFPVSSIFVLSGGAPLPSVGFLPFSPVCSCPGRVPGTNGRHRRGCPLDGATQRSAAVAAAASLSPSRQGPQVDLETVEAHPDPDLHHTLDLPPASVPSWYDVARLQCTLVDSIPRGAESAVSSAFTWTVDRLRVNEPFTFLRLFAFAKCLLFLPPRSSNLASVVRRRALAWRESPDAWLALWVEAVEGCRKSRSSTSAVDRFPLEESLKYYSSVDTSTVDADSLPPDVVARSIALAKRGFFSRAASSLSASLVATPSDTTADVMRSKHPSADLPVVSLELRSAAAAQEIPEFTHRSIVRSLRSFTHGTTPGCSGLSIDHLLSIATASGADRTSLPSLLSLFAKGKVPAEAAAYFGGARLVAFVKKDNDLRPIAIGDCLRRLTARLLFNSCNKDITRYLAARGQVGVGVPGGLEAVFNTARRTMHSWAQSGVRRKAFLKLDFRNAFNLIARSEVLEACAAVAPVMLPFVIMLYCIVTVLLFGAYIIFSQLGVQQGDPLGPPLFALAFAFLWDLVVREAALRLPPRSDPPPLPAVPPPPVVEPDPPAVLDFAAWFLDDGTLGAALDVLRIFYDLLLEFGPAFGVHLNPAKCEIVCDSSNSAEAQQIFPEFPATNFFSFNSFFLLGSPMGEVSSFCSAVVARAIRKVSLIRQMAGDPHVATVMLMYCGSFGLLVHLMRSCGASPHLALFDAAVSEAIAAIAGYTAIDLTLPLRQCGLGLRSTALHANAAHLASICASASAAPLLVPASFRLLSDPRAPSVLQEMLDAPHSCAAAEEATAYLAQAFPSDGSRATTSFRDKKQRVWSRLIDASVFAQLASSHTVQDTARVNSAGAPHASAWLSLPISDRLIKHQWLDPSEFRACISLRFGQPVHPGSSMACTLCHGRMSADRFGIHSTLCLGSGLRTRAHHAFRNWVFYLASAANLHPQLEQRPFASRPDQRIDVLINATRQVVDTATISCFALVHVAPAAAFPAGACNAYEQTKIATYGVAATTDGFKLIPAVVDCFGALSKSAITLIKGMIVKRADRHNASVAAALPAHFRDLSIIIQRAWAKLLLANAFYDLPSSGPPPSADCLPSAGAPNSVGVVFAPVVLLPPSAPFAAPAPPAGSPPTDLDVARLLPSGPFAAPSFAA